MKFACRRCGHCCRNLKRVRKLEDAGEKRPLYILEEERSLALYEWELDDFLLFGRKLNKQIEVAPVLICIDQLTNTPLGLIWSILDNDCPFLSESNLCLIYEHRPVICRIFPVAASGIFLSSERLKFSDVFQDCRYLADFAFPSVVRYRDFIAALHDCFGDIHVYSFHNERVQMILIDFLRELESRGIVRLARKRPLKFVKNLVSRKGVIGLFKFLRERKLVPEVYVVELLKRLGNYEFSRSELQKELAKIL
jgi:Fe-S-cluster containining protein